MDDERKYKISSMVGTTVLFGSCIGMSYYNDEEPEGYESIHEKLSMDTVITSSFDHGDSVGYNDMVASNLLGLF